MSRAQQRPGYLKVGKSTSRSLSRKDIFPLQPNRTVPRGRVAFLHSFQAVPARLRSFRPSGTKSYRPLLLFRLFLRSFAAIPIREALLRQHKIPRNRSEITAAGDELSQGTPSGTKRIEGF
jgi:hypothetical protein